MYPIFSSKPVISTTGNPVLEVIAAIHSTKKIIHIPTTPLGYLRNKTYNTIQNQSDELNRILKSDFNGTQFTNIQDFDYHLNTTFSTSGLPASISYSLSILYSLTASHQQGIRLYQFWGADRAAPMPIPVFNILDLTPEPYSSQTVLPVLLYSENKDIYSAKKIYHDILKSALKICINNGYFLGAGTQGGIMAYMTSIRKALDVILQAAQETAYIPGQDFMLGIDFESEKFWKTNTFNFPTNNYGMDTQEMIDYLVELRKSYPLGFIEDPFLATHHNGWKNYNRVSCMTTHIVGDFLVNNPGQQPGPLPDGLINTFSIKPELMSSVSDIFLKVNEGHLRGWKSVISHRSLEYSNDFLADIALASKAFFFKAGGTLRKNKASKYDRLMRICHGG